MSVRGAEGAGAAGPETKERRASGGQRVHFEALIAVGEGGGGFEAESVDVSPDGMRMRTAYLPAEGDKLVCRFDGMGTEIAVEGEVAWLREEAKGGEFGVRFVGLDEATAAAVRAMCMTLGDPGEDPASPEEPAMPRGSRVRLHIEGLGSPMKARVRDAASRELSVGSNLEFLKVGRTLELEDVEQGAKREATIDDVKVDVDPATNVPQLVVTLRFGKRDAETEADAPEKKRERQRTSAAPSRAGAAPEAAAKREKAASKAGRAEAPQGEDDGGAEGTEADAEGPGLAARAASAGRTVAEKLGPALAGMGLRAKGAMGTMVDLVQKRRLERAATVKSAAPRRTTAPAPGGGLTSDGRRLVRDEPLNDDEDLAVVPRTNHRAAATGGALGLLAVLAIFGATRLVSRGHTATTPADAHSAIAALPAAVEPPAAAPGTPTANVPLFGATPLSTTEPAAAPSALASAAPSAAPAPGGPGADSDDEPAAGDGSGNSLKEWGQGSVSHPIVLKIKMDGAIDRITGAAGAMGFTISVPGRRSVSSASDLVRKDKRLASVNVLNTSHGAEVSVQFKDGVPPYLAKVKGDRLEIAIGKEGHSKVAKSKKHKKKAKHDE